MICQGLYTDSKKFQKLNNALPNRGKYLESVSAKKTYFQFILAWSIKDGELPKSEYVNQAVTQWKWHFLKCLYIVFGNINIPWILED